VGSQYSSHYLGTWCIQHYYRWCAHLGCQQSTELTPPADLNGLVRFAEIRNRVSARVPSHFNWPLPNRAEHTCCATCHCQQNVTEDKASLLWKHRSLWLTGAGEKKKSNSYGPAFPYAKLLKKLLAVIDYWLPQLVHKLIYVNNL